MSVADIFKMVFIGNYSFELKTDPEIYKNYKQTILKIKNKKKLTESQIQLRNKKIKELENISNSLNF